MGTNLPISVVIPSYNHASYVDSAIESVLNQTLVPSEIIVVDDGSNDGSQNILKKYGDRISLTSFDKNRGAAVATNVGISLAKNSHVAILNSDDMWEPNKLENQYEWMRANNYDLCFTTASIIDENSLIVSNPPSFFEVFSRTSPVNSSYLYHFFYFGNFLCHPSLLIKREVYMNHGLYSNKYRQLPDLERWIHFSKFIKIGILNEKLVKFRWTDGLNTSNQSQITNYLRTQNEHLPLYLKFFENVPKDTIKISFEKEINALDPKYQEIAAIDPGTALLLGHPEPSVKYQTTIAGYLRLLTLDTTPEVDKAIQNIAGSFQVALNSDNLENHFMNQSFQRRVYEKLPVQIRKQIFRVLK